MEISVLATGSLSVNTWFIPLSANRLMVVDPGGDADKIIAYIRETGFAPECFLLTHGHFDHIAALGELTELWPQVPVIAHRDDAQWFGPGGRERHQKFFDELGAGFLVRNLKGDIPALDRTVADGEDVAGWEVFHTPGHSPGSICLYRDDVLIAGDTLFRQGIGRTDGPGGSAEQLMESLSFLMTLPVKTRVLPGHGPQTTIGAERGIW